jgi:ferredoxin--NADP+ reductase/benzoate/toluate 1,2-dioxygenase reductase subunit
MYCRVLQLRRLTDAVAVVRFERLGLAFEPGQYIRVSTAGSGEFRDYSIYSGASAGYLEVLVRRVEDGLVSPKLCDLSPGDSVVIDGPYGHFTLTEEIRSGPLLFVATRTGIAPFHCFIESYPDLDYRLLHGTAVCTEAYEAAAFGDRYTHCVSRETGGTFHGRVINYLHTQDVSAEAHAFLCGNYSMICEVFDLLQERGLSDKQIHTEIYF